MKDHQEMGDMMEVFIFLAVELKLVLLQMCVSGKQATTVGKN